jgi:multiple sugar transport system substrate-binding protein
MPLSLFKDSQNQEAAWEFLKWATNPDLEKAIVTNKENPDTTTNVAVQMVNLEDPDVNAAWDNMHQFAAQSLAVSRIMPQLAEWPEISNVLEVAINDIAAGAPTQETLDQAAVEIEAIMERAGYY